MAYQRIPVNTSPNPARTIAAESFKSTLKHLHGRPGIRERHFADQWFQSMRRRIGPCAAGWYDPPPNGLTVLAGPADSDSRISFTSLRDPANSPSEQIIDWAEGCLYAYCSPVDCRCGLPGDFAITLYFGGSLAIREHFIRAHAATQEVLSILHGQTSSVDIYHTANSIFQAASLKNEVVSVTDTTPLDLGHSLPTLVRSAPETEPLTATDRDSISRGRKFFNSVSEWPLAQERQVTIEPQLRSLENPDLPQASFHYTVNIQPLAVLREPDNILADWGLTS